MVKPNQNTLKQLKQELMQMYPKAKVTKHDALIADMHLADFALKKYSVKRQHTLLGRLLLMAVCQRPESVASSLDNNLSLTKLHVTDDTSPYRKMHGKILTYGRFKQLNSQQVDFESITENLHGDNFFYFILSIWNEISIRRCKLVLTKCDTQDYDLLVPMAVDIIKEYEKNCEEDALAPRHPGSNPVHFSLKMKNEEALNELLEAMEIERWHDGKIKVSDWIYRLTGHRISDEMPSPDPIQLNSLNQCHYIVKHVIIKDRDVTQAEWEKVAQVFAVKKGNIASVNKAYKIPAGSARIDKVIKKLYNS